MNYHITQNTDGASTAFVIYNSGESIVVPATHEKWNDIIATLLDGGSEEAVRALIDTTAQVKSWLSLSERVTFRGNKLFFDGDRIKGQLVKHILRLVKHGDDSVNGLIAFLEKVEQNPIPDSRDALYRWLNDRDFTILRDGDFVAYKGLQRGADHLSINEGTALVDGVKVTGCIPNLPGTVVTMPRASVETDRAIGCSTGLHAGTHQYASGFGSQVVSVRINPRDVVSVPDDSQFQKLRVCRYVVIEDIVTPYDDPIFVDDHVTFEDDDVSTHGLEYEYGGDLEDDVDLNFPISLDDDED